MSKKKKKTYIKEPPNPKVKLYLPTAKSKTKKARVRGFWRNEDGKVYYDYLRTVTVNRKELRRIRKETNEEALFYQYEDKAYIYSGGDPVCLRERKRYVFIRGELSFSELRAQFKRLLKQYCGLTVYIGKESYQVEVWL